MVLPPYPKVHKLGVRENAGLFDQPGTIVAQEKVDGSQFGFGFRDGVPSRTADIDMANPPKIFQAAVAAVKSLDCRLISEVWTLYA